MIARLSLQQRVIAATLLVLVLVLVLVNTVVLVALDATEDDDTREVLDARVEVAELLSEAVPADRLVSELAGRGIAAEVVPRPSGEAAPSVDPMREVVITEDGTAIAIYVATSTGDAARDRARTLLVAASVGGVLLAALVMLRASRTALRPLEDVVAAARSVAQGGEWTELAAASPGTEVGRLVAALDEMVEVLEHSLEEARQTNERTQRFLADAAHQLRTPLAGIRASAEILAMGPSREDAELLLANLVSDCERLTRLVTALLRMARIDQGEIATPVPSDLAVLCREELDRVRSRFPTLDVRLDVRGPSPQPIELDPASMSEALSNLLDNASRHARSSVTLRLSGEGPNVVIRIEDDGPGLDDVSSTRAFERFASFDDCGGTGLGLPIARGIFEAHQGSLDYEDAGFIGRLPRERRRWPRPGRDESLRRELPASARGAALAR
jgi:two-component system OmpR family sensor kinase